jgi:hypothetical protein
MRSTPPVHHQRQEEYGTTGQTRQAGKCLFLQPRLKNCGGKNFYMSEAM